MSNPFKLNDTPRSGPLAEAAERLDRVVSIVKDQQRARTNPGERPTKARSTSSAPKRPGRRST